VQRLSFELRAHRRHDSGMPVADVENSESAKTIDVLAAVDVGDRVAAVGPLDGGVERPLRTGLAVGEKSGIDVVAKALDGFADDPIGLRTIERLGGDEF